VPFAVVEVPLLVVVPFTVEVPPFGPVTLPLPVVPVRVFFTVAVPLTELPRAPVALPLAFSVEPVCVTLLEAVPPLRPVTVFCAYAELRGSIKAIAAAAINFIFMGISLEEYL
jgi:hypothetical protein